MYASNDFSHRNQLFRLPPIPFMADQYVFALVHRKFHQNCNILNNDIRMT